MYKIVDGDELTFSIKNYCMTSDLQGFGCKKGIAGELWIRQSEVLNLIEKHTVGFLCDSCFVKEEKKKSKR